MSMTGSSLALATVSHRRSPSELVQGDAIVDPDGWVLTTDELIKGAHHDEQAALAKQVHFDTVLLVVPAFFAPGACRLIDGKKRKEPPPNLVAHTALPSETVDVAL